MLHNVHLARFLKFYTTATCADDISLSTSNDIMVRESGMSFM